MGKLMGPSVGFLEGFLSVSHTKLLHRLAHCGIMNGKSLAWIAAFLHNRTQFVVVNGTHSTTAARFVCNDYNIATSTSCLVKSLGRDTLEHRRLFHQSVRVESTAPKKKNQVLVSDKDKPRERMQFERLSTLQVAEPN